MLKWGVIQAWNGSRLNPNGKYRLNGDPPMILRHNVTAVFSAVFALSVAVFPIGSTPAAELVGHWLLGGGDCSDASGNGNHGVNHGVDLGGDDAVFDGIDDYIEVPGGRSLMPQTESFSISVWVHTKDKLDDVLGDIIDKFDPETRTGVTLSLMNYAGVTNAQSNYRNLSFGIDAGRGGTAWVDCGRPGNNYFVRSLTVYDGNLYASTWEPKEGDAGHVYRYAGGTKWIDCGAPDRSNTVASLAVFDGKLYAGTERYTGSGSSLKGKLLSPNKHPGGKVFCYEGGSTWSDCGNVAEGVVSISGLAVFDGKLYAGTGTSSSFRSGYPRTKGMYRYDGKKQWTDCGCPNSRIVHLGVHNGHIYGLSYDCGHIFRYDGGTDWTDLGPIPQTTQSYSFMVYRGRPVVCTWPIAQVFRYDGSEKWTSIGRQGEEEETMAVSIYNGKLYVGTLPLAQVYRHDDGTNWTLTGRLDHTPDVRYRRAWSMAVFDGKLFCGVLPSGHVHSLEAGKCVTYDKALKSGWRHIAAVKTEKRLKLYIDGTKVAESSDFNPKEFNLANDSPLRIGFGQHDYFNGKMKNLRIYHGALSNEDVSKLAK